MDNIFRTRALTAAVNLIKPAPNRILSRLFTNKKMQVTDRFAWEIKTSSERIMKNIAVADPASVADLQGRKIVTTNAPRFAEKRLITAADLNAIRAFGSNAAPELMAERVRDELTDMRGKIDRTREFMAAKALSGQIVDDTGTVLVDFNFSGTQKPALTTTSRWSDPESKPLTKIREWKKLLEQAVGTVNEYVAFCNSNVMDAMLENPSLVEFLKYTVGSQVAQQGRIVNMAGVSIEEYNGSYIDANGARQDLIPANYFVLVGVTSDATAELYAPCVDLKDPAGVGGGLPASVFFSKSWETEDPSGRWIKVEARPLPVLIRPECIIYAKVI
jgi:hypothetical protein